MHCRIVREEVQRSCFVIGQRRNEMSTVQQPSKNLFCPTQNFPTEAISSNIIMFRLTSPLPVKLFLVIALGCGTGGHRPKYLVCINCLRLRKALYGCTGQVRNTYGPLIQCTKEILDLRYSIHFCIHCRYDCTISLSTLL